VRPPSLKLRTGTSHGRGVAKREHAASQGRSAAARDGVANFSSRKRFVTAFAFSLGLFPHHRKYFIFPKWSTTKKSWSLGASMRLDELLHQSKARNQKAEATPQHTLMKTKRGEKANTWSFCKTLSVLYSECERCTAPVRRVRKICKELVLPTGAVHLVALLFRFSRKTAHRVLRTLRVLT
jgi:hypothetical protein